MFEKFEKYLKKLQNSDEDTKRQATIIGTIIIMAIIVLIWFQFFNPVAQQTTAAPEQNKISFFSTFQNGLGIVGNAIGSKIKDFSHFLSAPRQYIINPTQK
ncbi:MAG: hypothetical protein M1334_00655 [Patescibacteria group bacterium]|nr:hypothetical protein [Patescibacteria group bacterium]